MYRDVENYITNCKICQTNSVPYFRAQFKKTEFHPWDKLYLDIVEPLPMTEDYKYILTCQHNLSKYLVAISMFTQTAEEVALNFLRYVVLQYGIPSSIVTDQGTQFMRNI
jgi:hypothetical protein